MSRYVVVGAGAVGVTLAAELGRTGVEVVVVGHGHQLEQLAAGTLQYLRPGGGWTVDAGVAEGPSDVDLAPGDVLVVATKTQDADAVLAEWAARPVAGGRWRAGEVLPVFTLQNGLDAERAALRRFATVIGSVLRVPSTYLADGVVSNPATPAAGAVWLGAHPDGPVPAAALALATDLIGAGFEVQVVEDLSRWKAAKLLAGVTFALDALYAPGPERSAPLAWRDEAEAVLVAAGLDPASEAESTVAPDRVAMGEIDGHPRPGNSTWQSMARGRPVETDFLNGEVVLLARQHRRRAPVNAALLSRVQRAVQERTPPGSLPPADLLATLATTVLVDAGTLAAELVGSQPPALLDVRWALGAPDGEKDYLERHLPGAVYVDLPTELAAPPRQPGAATPLPEVADLEQAARRWGLAQGQPVVVYDDSGGQSAARAWWLLRWAGVADVRLLDGGLAAWVDAGHPIDTGSHRPEPGDVALSGGHLPTIDADGAASLAREGALLDARAAARYRGEVEPVDPRAGHIPGAQSLPTADNLRPDGRFLDVAGLQARFDPVRAAGPVGVYCGSGVTAAHEIAALAVAGIDAALFPGSWSAWSADPARPVAVGPDPS